MKTIFWKTMPSLGIVWIDAWCSCLTYSGNVVFILKLFSFQSVRDFIGPQKITWFTVDVTNTRDKECLADVTKVLITGKTILTESELETAKLDTVIHTWNNSIHGILCTYIMRRLLRIYTNKLKQLHKQLIAPLRKISCCMMHVH